MRLEIEVSIGVGRLPIHIGESAYISCDTNRLDFSERLCQPICRVEVAWALEKKKKDAAPGKGGVTVDSVVRCLVCIV